MKKIIPLLLVALFATTFVSCSKDNEDLILGTWKITETSRTVYNHPIESHNRTTTEPTTGGYVRTLTFNEDKTCVAYYKYTDEDGVDEDSDTFTYSINGDELSIFQGYMGVRYHIDKLDSENLVLSVTEEHTYHYDIGGSTIYYEKNSIIMKKI